MKKRKTFLEDESSDSSHKGHGESPKKRFKLSPNCTEQNLQSQKEKRRIRDATRKRMSRDKESPNSKIERKKREAMRKREIRSKESTPVKKARLAKAAEKMRQKRNMESTPEKKARNEKIAQQNRLKRNLESTPVKKDRIGKCSSELTPVKKVCIEKKCGKYASET